MLTIKHAIKKRRSHQHRGIWRCHRCFEDGLKNGWGLDNVELCSINLLACSLKQPGLEELDWCGDTKEQSKGDTWAPRASTVSRLEVASRMDNILEENDQIGQQTAVETLTVLKCDKNMLAVLKFDECVQCFKIIVKIPSALYNAWAWELHTKQGDLPHDRLQLGDHRLHRQKPWLWHPEWSSSTLPWELMPRKTSGQQTCLVLIVEVSLIVAEREDPVKQCWVR